MKNLKVNLFIYILLVVSFIAYAIILYLVPVTEKTLLNYAKIIPTVVTVDSFLVLLFTKYLWKWSIFHDWLVPFPDLNGTYKGTIRTTWIDPQTGERPYEAIDGILTINQSFFGTSCVMRTSEMTSYSMLADFIVDAENQVKKLSYTYNSNPKQTVTERSPKHFGTAVFDIDDSQRLRLAGEYWTDRKTTGVIEMVFWTKKKVSLLPQNMNYHPVSAARKTEN